MTIDQIQIGDRVTMRPAFGAGAPVLVVVTDTDADIKNGRPGFTYVDPNDPNGERWAYLTQVCPS